MSASRDIKRGTWKIYKSKDMNMLFSSFVEIYLNDMKPRIKYNTYLTKVTIIENKILPFFKIKNFR